MKDSKGKLIQEGQHARITPSTPAAFHRLGHLNGERVRVAGFRDGSVAVQAIGDGGASLTVQPGDLTMEPDSPAIVGAELEHIAYVRRTLEALGAAAETAYRQAANMNDYLADLEGADCTGDCCFTATYREDIAHEMGTIERALRNLRRITKPQIAELTAMERGDDTPHDAYIRRPRNRITDDHLAKVAVIYKHADAGGHPPTRAVAVAFNASHSTAARWVGQARKKDLLPPAAREDRDDK